MGSITNLPYEGFICRLCCHLKRSVIFIFGMKGRQLDLLNKINSYLPVEVNENDDLPKTICQSCLEKILQHHQLIERIQQVQKHFLTMRNEHDGNVERHANAGSGSNDSRVNVDHPVNEGLENGAVEERAQQSNAIKNDAEQAQGCTLRNEHAPNEDNIQEPAANDGLENETVEEQAQQPNASNSDTEGSVTVQNASSAPSLLVNEAENASVVESSNNLEGPNSVKTETKLLSSRESNDQPTTSNTEQSVANRNVQSLQTQPSEQDSVVAVSSNSQQDFAHASEAHDEQQQSTVNEEVSTSKRNADADSSEHAEHGSKKRKQLPLSH